MTPGENGPIYAEYISRKIAWLITKRSLHRKQPLHPFNSPEKRPLPTSLVMAPGFLLYLVRLVWLMALDLGSSTTTVRICHGVPFSQSRSRHESPLNVLRTITMFKSWGCDQFILQGISVTLVFDW